MKQLVVIFSVLIGLHAAASVGEKAYYEVLNADYVDQQLEEFELESELFSETESEEVKIEDIKVIELEEEVDLFDNNYFAYADNSTLEVEDIQVYELEETVQLGFDTKQYLPEGFNPYEGMSCESLVVVSLY